MTDIQLIHGDSLQALKGYGDNHFDWAIIDPPYGIGAGVSKTGGASKHNSMSRMKNNSHIYDDIKPEIEFFEQLLRVSKSQIIFGGNYFADMLPPTRCFIVWDKMNYLPSMSQIELAWTSENRHSELVKINSNQNDRFHISQKPVALYEWCLDKFTNEGDLILDTHLGSGSIAIACHYMKRKLIAYEIDAEYYEKACKRFKEQTAQQALW